MSEKSNKRLKKAQHSQFKNLARKLEVDESEEMFDKALENVGTSKPQAAKPGER